MEHGDLAVVLPSEDPKLVLNLKPVAGLDAQRTGVFLPLEKTDIEPAVEVPSNYARLAWKLPRNDLSVYAHYPHLVASIDFVKSGSLRHFLLQYAPNLIIVDEAHLATRPRGATDDRPITQTFLNSLLKPAFAFDFSVFLAQFG